jgi:hypothetical protein
LDECGGQNDRQADQQQNGGKRREPIRSAESFGQRLDDFEDEPGSAGLNRQRLPERAAVRFL